MATLDRVRFNEETRSVSWVRRRIRWRSMSNQLVNNDRVMAQIRQVVWQSEFRELTVAELLEELG
jgi:hypothetical protein